MTAGWAALLLAFGALVIWLFTGSKTIYRLGWVLGVAAAVIFIANGALS